MTAPDPSTTPVCAYDGPAVVHPRRIVSLVPSLTHTVVQLGGADRLVGRSRYCCSPTAAVAGIPVVGGAKDPDLAAILARQPDLILLDRDENRREDAQRLTEAGVSLVTFHPRQVMDVLSILNCLGDLLAAPAAATALGDTLRRVLEERDPLPASPLPALCLIWMAPYMSCNGRTYMSDMMRLAGFRNVFQAHPRRYFSLTPADLPCQDAARTAVLLPSEPYAFTPEDSMRVSHDFGIPPERVRRIKGEYLAWYGAITAEALASLTRLGETFPADREN